MHGACCAGECITLGHTPQYAASQPGSGPNIQAASLGFTTDRYNGAISEPEDEVYGEQHTQARQSQVPMLAVNNFDSSPAADVHMQGVLMAK